MTLISPERTYKVAMEVIAERGHQDSKWGEQSHPNGTSHDRYFVEATMARRVCELATTGGRLTWDLILLEEVYEALTESDPALLRAELIQVAAVATAWVEKIDRDTAKEPSA